MSQITESFREFLESGRDPFGDGDREFDRIAIAVVHDVSRPMSERVSALRKWWWQYSVSRTLREGEHKAVAQSLIEYFDSRAIYRLSDGPDIVKEFEALETVASGHRLAEFHERRLTSLVSKTLWLFYPDQAPMYDSYAFAALRVLSRLYGFRVDVSAAPFAQFFQAWRQGFLCVESSIPQKEWMPHKVRVFDAFLWWLGQGAFEALDT